MINKTLFLFLAVAVVPSLAVLNNNNNKEAQRRDAPILEAYGPPQVLQLPAPVYGQPAFATYPAPPPELPPPAPMPHKEYGVPVSKYGPPTTVNIEYGPPQSRPQSPQKPAFFGQSLPSFNQVSFFDQIKSMFTGTAGKQAAYGPPPRKQFQKPGQNYGPPPQHQGRPTPNYGPPPQHHGPPAQNYGPPPQHHGPPAQNYGPPPQHHGPPAQNYGPPPQHHGPPAQNYGPPPQQHGHIHRPQQVHHHVKPNQNYGPPPSHGPPQNYGPPQNFNTHKPLGPQFASNGGGGSGTPFRVNCDGWKPIPGPAIPYDSTGPSSSYGPPASGNFGSSGGGNSFEHSGNGASFSSSGGGSSSFAQSSGTSYSAHSGGSASAEQNANQDIGLLLSLPSVDGGQAFNVGAGFDVAQSHGQELTNYLGGGDSYSAPPIETYAPGTYAPSFLLKKEQSTQNTQNSFDHHSIGLIPPGGKYGAPNGGSSFDAGLAIQHGSVSGNLKPWPVKGAAPKQPLSFREPVPVGLIESIGQTVAHLDNFGTRPQQQSGVYLPPPTGELPVPSHELNILPINQAPQQFLTQHSFEQNNQQNNFVAEEHHNHIEQSLQLVPPQYNAPQFQVQQFNQQSNQFNAQQSNSHNFHSHQQSNAYPAALPLIQEPRYSTYSGMNDCGRGPQTFGGHGQTQFQQQAFVSDSYGLPAQGQDNGHFQQQGLASDSYGPPPQYQQQTLHSNVVTSYQVAPIVVDSSVNLETPQSSYGPPASGNPIDNQGYESQVKSATTTITGESKDTVGSESSQLNLPGLSSVAGLDLLSAQKSQSLEIPVQGALGSYQLQFQSAEPIGSASNDIEHPPHQQILSEGLLQSILSAIEQPNQGNAIPQASYDQQTDHSDAAVFLDSLEGQKVLSEPAKTRR